MTEVALLAAVALGSHLTDQNTWNLACLHGEDWVISVGTFRGMEEHVRGQVIFLSQGDPELEEALYNRAISCAREMGAERDIKPPPGWNP